jgi:hypothetical protein
MGVAEVFTAAVAVDFMGAALAGASTATLAIAVANEVRRTKGAAAPQEWLDNLLPAIPLQRGAHPH